MKRIQNPEEKKKPGITAQVSLNIPFSVSIDMSLADKFSIACKNDYSNKSQIFKRIIHRKMNIKDDHDFQKAMSMPIKIAREEIYKLMGIKEGDFSKVMAREFEEYVKKNEVKR